MGWPKGKPRPQGAGRKKGTPNKNSLNLQEKLDAFEDGKGFDPVYEALKLYTLIYADNPLVAVKIPLTLMEYIYPKRKAIEHSGSEGGPIEIARRLENIPDQELLKLLPEAVKLIEEK